MVDAMGGQEMSVKEPWGLGRTPRVAFNAHSPGSVSRGQKGERPLSAWEVRDAPGSEARLGTRA